MARANRVRQSAVGQPVDRPLDRSLPAPLWAQLEADLRRRVRDGEFDERFPGEHELVAQYRVSRHTVRDALRRLREDGVLDAGRGRGTWVRKPVLEQPIGALYSLFRSVEAIGLEQRSVVRQLEIRTDPDVAARLGRRPESEFVYLERLRLADSVPLALDRAWLPRDLAEPLLGADFTHCALYDQLAELTGLRLTGGSEVITAITPDAQTRRLLRLSPGAAVMEIRRLGRLDDEHVEWRQTLVRGDRFSVAATWSAGQGYLLSVSAPSDPIG